MLGTNEVAKARLKHEPFLVHSVFYTIQGESPFSGYPAIFLRLAGCNLRCTWCDTEFEHGFACDLQSLSNTIRSMSNTHDCKLVVITGGEPLLQPIGALLSHPALGDIQWQIETAGTVWPDGNIETWAVGSWPSRRLTFVCSPKTPIIVTQLASVQSYNVYWKYIIRADEPVSEDDGLPMYSTQIKGKKQTLFRPFGLAYMKDRIFVSPCDMTDEIRASGVAVLLDTPNEQYAAQIAMKHGYRLSLQVHKIVNVE